MPAIVAGEEEIMNVDYLVVGIVAISVITISFLYLGIPFYQKYKEEGMSKDDRKVLLIYCFVAIPLCIIVGSVMFATKFVEPILNEEIPKKVVWVVPAPADAPEFVEGVVAEAPIPLGGGICLVGVFIGDFHDRRNIRAVLVSADRPLVVGQKVKVKIRLISETHRPASDLLVIQDEMAK